MNGCPECGRPLEVSHVCVMADRKRQHPWRAVMAETSKLARMLPSHLIIPWLRSWANDLKAQKHG